MKAKENEYQDKGISQIDDEGKRVDAMRKLIAAEKTAMFDATNKST